jgi:Raf kinase inhibitor-like YbhB/YbcL family protein
MIMKRILLISITTPFLSLYAQTFTLKSKDIGGQATSKQVFNSFGCTGENISPQLSWENAPKETKSFAVTMYDPDAPTGSGWWHWVVFDIPANTKEIKSGAGDVLKTLLPAGTIQSTTDFGKPGYGGPCPPEGHGFHTYIFTVYALKVDKLGLDATASPAMVGYYINSNMLEKASIVMYYKR